MIRKSKAPISQRSPTLRFIRWSTNPQRLRTGLKRGGIGLIVLLSLLVLFSVIEQWRGRRAWEQAKIEAETQGIDFNWEKYIPVPIPDSKNLVCAPIMVDSYRPDPQHRPKAWPKESLITKDLEQRSAALHRYFGNWNFGNQPHDTLQWQHNVRGERFDYPKDDPRYKKGYQARYEIELPPLPQDFWDDVATILEPARPLLVEIREECMARPESYFPGDYSVPYSAPIPAFNTVRTYSRLLQAEAMLAIHEGNTTLALQNVYAMTRIGSLGKRPNFLVNMMIEVVVMQMATRVLACGLEQQMFSESELLAIIKLAQEYNMLLDFGESLKTECVRGVAMMQLHIATHGKVISNSEEASLLLVNFEHQWDPLLVLSLWHFTPSEGWNWQMLARYVQNYCMCLSAFDFENETFDYQRFDHAEAETREMLDDPDFFDLFASISFPAFQKVMQNIISCQRQIDLIGLAASIELHRLNSGVLPNSLDELTIEDSQVRLLDRVTGESGEYRTIDNGFELSWPDEGGLDEQPVRLQVGNATRP